MLKPPEIGSCQCGACEYSFNALPYVAYTCHCRECQRLSSSAFNTCIQVPAESVTIKRGTPATRSRTADSGNVLTTWFCSACGSAMYSQNSARPRIKTVYVGTLAHPESIEVNAHIWVKRQFPWVILPSHHRIFQETGDWTQDYANDIERYKPNRRLEGDS